jgi:hypothetical protein
MEIHRDVLRLQGQWTADPFGPPDNAAASQYNRRRPSLDVGSSVKRSSRYSVVFTGRNVWSEPLIAMQTSGNNPASARITEVTRSVWSGGVKVVF